VKKISLAIVGSGVVFFGLAIALVVSAQTSPADRGKDGAGAAALPGTFEVRGQTQCSPQRRGILAPVVLHPVTEVKVSVGDTVKKGQLLIQLDDDEPQADVRVKKAVHQNAEVAMKEARRYLTSLEALQTTGIIGEQRIHEARATALKAEADERAAKANIELSMAELEHYTVSAPIDGVVNRLEVYTGMVSRPGTTVWGEVLDISELDVRCLLTVAQAESVKVGDQVEVLSADLTKGYGTGRLVFVGLAATGTNGTIPALARVANRAGKLRCEVPVQLRFTPK
jgi:RND family efflux transporter MFP subunit